MRFSVVLLGFSCAAVGLAPAGAQPAAQAVAAPGQAIDIEGQGLAVNMSLTASEPDHPQAGGKAKITGQIDQLQTHVELGAISGQPAPSQGSAGAADASGWWNTTTAGVGASWTPSGAAKFEIGAQNATRVEFTASDPVFGDAGQHFAQHRTTAASAAATLTPVAPLDVKFGANLSTELEQTAAIAGSGAETHDQVQTEQRQMSAALAWKPLSALSLEAGGTVQSTSLMWSAGRAAAFADLDPDARLSLTPWSGGSLELTLDRSTAPLTQAQFLGYATGGAEAVLPLVQPSREWRYGAAVTQKAGPIDLSASLIQARVQTYAYMAPFGAYAARVGMGEGDRREIQAGLAAPLPLFGWAPFTLEAKATWRDSLVQDPLTGALGRLSGERPYDATLSLSHAIGPGMRWGVTARAAGPQINLGPSEVASLSPTAGFGGFVQVQTRPLTLRLSLDNIVGGDRSEHDVIYTGLRDASAIDHISEIRTTDRGVRLSLIRPL
ncbi:MAG TPA: hypothetical protein VGM25_18130 [Caulobacteraceae bacterium]|jgi:hypothetical protein